MYSVFVQIQKDTKCTELLKLLSNKVVKKGIKTNSQGLTLYL